MKVDFELNGGYEDFIGSYVGACPLSFCDEIVKSFDYHQDIGSVFCEDDHFANSNAGRFDWAMNLDFMAPQMEGEPVIKLNSIIHRCFREYVHVFGHLKQVPLYSSTQKVQRTPPGGGYHVWHDENCSYECSDRVLVWMIYLNDDYEGGETEFLYYKKRVKPQKGKVLIFPAGMTHCHKGGMVLNGNSKYIVTGWFYSVPDNVNMWMTEPVMDQPN